MPRPTRTKDSKNKNLHWFVWPIGEWKGRRLPTVPLDYLRNFVRNPQIDINTALVKKAAAEIKRRSFEEDYVHTTEHVVERFTQQWLDVIVRHQERSKKPIGAIFIIKALFKRALAKGKTTKGEGGSDPNFKVTHGRYRWFYCIYRGDKGVQEMKVISVMPATKAK